QHHLLPRWTTTCNSREPLDKRLLLACSHVEQRHGGGGDRRSSSPPSHQPASSRSQAVSMSSLLGQGSAPYPLPRVTIQFCTQCKWMLRAAYYAQELLSTFSLSLGEVALQPSTGGTFIVAIHHHQLETHRHQEGESQAGGVVPVGKVLWDRKVDGGFPETKELKRRVRDVIEPSRDLGHVDRDYAKEKKEEGATLVKEREATEGAAAKGGEGGKCEDCAS
ncbi:hypothetical protein TOPH_00659, partial [Tolypocladium ophioglossoides CBS 100239]